MQDSRYENYNTEYIKCVLVHILYTISWYEEMIAIYHSHIVSKLLDTQNSHSKNSVSFGVRLGENYTPKHISHMEYQYESAGLQCPLEKAYGGLCDVVKKRAGFV